MANSTKANFRAFVPVSIHKSPDLRAADDFHLVGGDEINPYTPNSTNWHRYHNKWTDLYLLGLQAEQDISRMGGEPTGPYVDESPTELQDLESLGFNSGFDS